MKLSKLYFLFLLFIAHTAFADIAIPKNLTLPNTKYYFANVDSFSSYKFFVKKITNNKTYKLKQDAAFLVKPAEGNANNNLEVWAVNKNNNQKTNVLVLEGLKTTDAFESNTAHVAILFSFDKKSGKLTYTETIMKPDCYGKKKQSIPFFVTSDIFNKPENRLNLLISAFSLILLLLFIKNRNQQKIYA